MSPLRILVLIVSLLALAGCQGESHGGEPTSGHDLGADAEAGLPIVVAFFSHDCPYCRFVKEQHLEPREREVAAGDYAPTLFRVVDINSGESMVDFDGESISARDFARRHGARFTPTLKFFDPRGEEQAEPLIGVSSEDYYGGHLDERIAQVRATLD